uniref:Uncharacterized protein n=1 Tax=Glossina palpalis gambiensis TaxID=67801 RepID=A0A1B0ALV6_9MUSC
MYWTAIILIVSAILLWDFIQKKRVRNHFRKHGIPGPKLTLPLIGDVLTTMGTDPTNRSINMCGSEAFNNLL